jgi:hypothetical protein
VWVDAHTRLPRRIPLHIAQAFAARADD